MEKLSARYLKDISFPECSRNCLSIEYFGASECDSICPWKFEEEINENAKEVK
jgi:hypothetical protein